MKIKTKLLLSFLVTTLLPVLIVSAFTIHKVTNEAHDNFVVTSSEDMALAENIYTTFFRSVENNLSAVAEYAAVRDTEGGDISTYFDPAHKQKPAQVATAKGGREKQLFDYFTNIGANNPSLGYVYMGDEKGGYVEWPGTGEYSDWDSRKRPWYTIAKAAGFQIARRDGYYWEPDKAVYVSVVKSFKNKQNQFGGVVAMDVSLKSLTDMTQKIHLGKTGFFMLVQGDGTLLVDGHDEKHNFKKLTELADPYFATVAKTDGGVVEVTIDGVSYMANIRTSPTLGWKLVGFQQTAEIYAGARALAWLTIIVSVVLVILFVIAGVLIAKRISTPINLVKDGLKTIAQGEGDLTHRLAIHSGDETGELAKWFNQFIESTRQMIVTIKGNAETINQVSGQTSDRTAMMSATMKTQLKLVEQIVSAVSQMVQAANDVAKNCVHSAEVSEQGLTATRHGKQVIQRSANGVNQLGDAIRQSSEVILALEKETENINSILSTIQQITEQTNLLALNAAIEAARAGEQGRGFAVVADEVRSLAMRTQDCTGQIDRILNLLVTRIQTVTSTMDHSLKESGEAIRLSTAALDAFDRIESSVQSMRDMTMHIAGATEEQHRVTENINQHIQSIQTSVNQVFDEATEVTEYAKEQSQLSHALSQRMVRFRTE